MPAPSPVPALATPLHLLGAGAFAAAGFVAVRLGFGAAGYGTDAHALRVAVALAPLLVCGLVLLRPKTRPAVRALAAVGGLGAAALVWWTVPSAGGEGALSLREAAAERDRSQEWIATPTVEAFEQRPPTKKLYVAFRDYPSLTSRTRDEFERWESGVIDDLVARYDRTAADDIKTAVALRGRAKSLAEIHSTGTERLDAAAREWRGRAAAAKVAELLALSGDWEGFERTAPGRRALADAFPEVYPALVEAEDEWGRRSVGPYVLLRHADRPVGLLCLERHKQLMALNALDTTDGRFGAVRNLLFVAAHDAVQRTIAAHLDAGRYDVAFGVARKHAVEWHATAAVLGAGEVKKLDALREHCESLAKLFEVSAKPLSWPTDLNKNELPGSG